MEKITSQESPLIDTPTTNLQRETEDECKPYFIDTKKLTKNQIDHLRELGVVSNEYDKSFPLSEYICLLRSKHLDYLQRSLLPKESYCLSKSFISLDASKPWIIYWCLQPLDLLGAMDTDGVSSSIAASSTLPVPTTPFLKEDSLIGIVHTLESCWMDIPHRLQDVDSCCYTCLFGDSDDDDMSIQDMPTQCLGGGYGGGPGQLPHCATSYAAILSLCIVAGCDTYHYPLATKLAQEVLFRKRKPLYLWFLSLQCSYPYIPDTVAYCMHHDGEIDVRATYTVLCMASLLNILTPALTRGVLPFIASCQTYEGGFGGEPHAEAHGGYTYCALAALRLLTASPMSCSSSTHCIHHQKESSSLSPNTTSHDLLSRNIDLDALKGWLVFKQKTLEGGFAGRTNKLVDGCYSFWLGASIALLNIIEKCYESSHGENYGIVYDAGIQEQNEFWISHSSFEDNEQKNNSYSHHAMETSLPTMGCDKDELLFDRTMLQRYILLCCQDLNGGLRDKPSKPRDFYHSCYVLSGLSTSEHVLRSTNGDDSFPVYGDCKQNLIFATHPVYNIRLKHVQQAFERLHNMVK